MNQNLIANILSLTLFIVSLSISLYAFFLCFQSFRGSNDRLIVLGLSMGLISLTAMASFAADNITTLPLNVNWFKYISQTVCFLFICLSLAYKSDKGLRRLVGWQVIASVLLLLLLTPILPTDFPDPVVTKTLLGGSRSLICFIIFYFYVFAFMRKQTRFSLLMSGAFLMLTVGYVLNIPKYIVHSLTLLDNVGDVMRIFGFIILFIAVLQG